MYFKYQNENLCNIKLKMWVWLGLIFLDDMISFIACKWFQMTLSRCVALLPCYIYICITNFSNFNSYEHLFTVNSYYIEKTMLQKYFYVVTQITIIWNGRYIGKLLFFIKYLEKRSPCTIKSELLALSLGEVKF